MHPGDIALIRQAVLATGIALIERLALIVIELGRGQAFVQEPREAGAIGLGHYIAVHRGKAGRGGLDAVEQHLDALLGVLAAVLPPEALQEHHALAIGEARQVVQAFGVVVVAEQCGAIAQLVAAVADQVAQQPHERQVDRFAQGLAQCRQAMVVLVAEVAETVHSRAGEEPLGGARRVAPLHRRDEHGRQAAVLVAGQVVQCPAAQRVLGLDLTQRLAVEQRMALMQLGDHFKIGGEHPQLGGGAQLQLAALVDVERLVGAVSLHPYLEALLVALEQGEAVAHLGGLFRRQHTVAEQPHLLGESRIGQAPQVFADLPLQGAVQWRDGGQVEAVEVVQRQPQQAGQTRTGDADALGDLDRLRGRLAAEIAQFGAPGKGSIAQRQRDQAVAGEQAQVTVGERRQLVAPGTEIVGRTALGDQQRQHLAQRQALGGQAAAGVVARIEQAVDLGEVRAEPEAQAIGEAVYFAMPGYGGQRHAVEVGQDDVLPAGEGLRSFAIGAHAGRDHLP